MKNRTGEDLVITDWAIRKLTLEDLREKIVGGAHYITNDLLPRVRQLGVNDLLDFDKMTFPNGTASACLDSLQRLVDIAKQYRIIIDQNSVVLDDVQWDMLANALRTLGMHPEQTD
jgi:hypothetical protein